MTSSGYSRKRPAPGADPVSVTYPPQMATPVVAVPGQFNNDGLGPNLSNDEFFQWGQTGQPAAPYNDNTFALNANTYPQPAPQPSTELTRRPINQIVAPTRVHEDGSTWLDTTNGGPDGADADWGDDIANLEARAQVAKREAQAKRKQIPPFVQKLNSFLEDGRNTELIRWSDDGNSFVVLDEDEFAKTLIPELFKHNNYASFVRQLNMYGFHKKVGLSDNSMRASERKNKSPSEYSNPFFRRGHPDLLWLIQKPKNLTGQGSKRKGKADSEQIDEDGDDYVDDVLPTAGDNRVRARSNQLTLGNTSTALTQEQFKSVQRELAAIRHQQSQISRMMQQLRREHEQLYGQAATFQDQHNRHENSINAILTFLATVYNRNLQNHDGIVNMASLFANGIPVPVDGTNQGNVVDVGDYSFNDLDLDANSPGMGQPYKKQPLLLTNGTGRQDRATTLSPSASAVNTPYPPDPKPTRNTTQRTVLSPNVEEIFDQGANNHAQNVVPPPGQTSKFNPDLPPGQMMSVINKANARNKAHPSNSTSPTTPVQDFSHVLNNLEAAGGNGPLSTSQRADVLKMINNTAKQPPGHDNALINSTPPPGPVNFHRRLASTQADLNHLAKLQAEQDKSVQNLTNLLQPLSPTGSIPGINDGQALPPPPLDIDDFLNQADYFTDIPSDGHGNYQFGSTGLDDPNPSGVGDAGAGVGTDGLNFVDFKDDDEMFGDLNSNPPPVSGRYNNNNNFGLDGTTSPDAGGNQYGHFDGANDYNQEEDGGGRVESMPSSEQTTPPSADDKPAAHRPPPARRGKGRKVSLADGDDDDSPVGRKRQRA